MTRRFTAGVTLYAALCVVGITVILVRGDGPHPRAIAIYPFNGDQYWPGGSAQITFSQTMDTASVARAIQVSPGSQGQEAWYGNTLNLQPIGDWRPNVTYHVRLTGSVTDDQGRPLAAPVSFWFRVHHVETVGVCLIGGVRNVCEVLGKTRRALTHSLAPVQHFALSPDGSMLAFTHVDRSGLPHVFIAGVDGTGVKQLTGGTAYADGAVQWPPHNNASIDYFRRAVLGRGTGSRRGPAELWNVNIDGSNNARLSG